MQAGGGGVRVGRCSGKRVAWRLQEIAVLSAAPPPAASAASGPHVARACLALLMQEAGETPASWAHVFFPTERLRNELDPG